MIFSQDSIHHQEYQKLLRWPEPLQTLKAIHFQVFWSSSPPVIYTTTKQLDYFSPSFLQPHFAGWCLSLEANPQKGTYNNSRRTKFSTLTLKFSINLAKPAFSTCPHPSYRLGASSWFAIAGHKIAFASAAKKSVPKNSWIRFWNKMNIISTLGFLDYFLSPLTKDCLLEPWEYNSVYNGLVWGTNADCSRARGEQCQGPTDRPQTRRPDRTQPGPARERGNHAENDWETLGPNDFLVHKSLSVISNLGLEVKSN